MPGSYDQFRLGIRIKESSNNYSIVSDLGYLGAYQLGEQALVDIGWVNNDSAYDNSLTGGFTGLFGVQSVADFLANHAAQDAAADAWFQRVWIQIRANDQEFYDQQTLNGVTLTISGMIAGAHLMGANHGGLRTFIDSGGTSVPDDDNNVPITQYITQFADFTLPFSPVNNLGNANTIDGGSGNDVLRGFGGNDTLSGKGGNDILIGGGGADTFVAGTGLDTFWGGDADDFAIEPGGNDTVDYSGLGGSLRLTFHGVNTPISDATYMEVASAGGASRLWGIERVIGTAGHDYFDFNGVVPDNYFLTVNAGGGGETYGEVIRLLGAGDGMRLNIGSSSGTLYSEGSSGRIYLQGFHTSIIGSVHDDEIVDEAEGEKRIDGGDGDDVIALGGDAGNSKLAGGLGADIITGGDGNDVIVGDPAPSNEFNQLNGGDGADHIVGDSSNDVIDGGDGHDYIEAAPGSTVRGGEGNDVIDFAHSSGSVFFGADSGRDFIIASDPSNNNDDVLIYAEGFSPGDVTIVVEDIPGFRCHLAVLVGGASLVLLNVPGSPTGAILHLIFAGNQSANWNDMDVQEGSVAQYIVAPDDYAAATAGDSGPTEGGSGGDHLQGGNGDDSLSGAAGDDSFGSSGGNDSIDGGDGNDTLNLFGSRSGFAVGLDQGTGSIEVEDLTGLEGVMTLTAVEAVYFATDNETWVMADLVGYHGTSGADTLTGTDRDNEMFGYGGDDVLAGGGGMDMIDGGDGADSLSGGGDQDMLDGGDGDDSLAGGAGYDTLSGGLGDDTYLYALGDDDDHVADSGGFDVLSFGAGLLVADLRAEIGGDDYVLWFEGAVGSVTILGGLLGPSGIEELRFEDETVWTAQDLHDLAYVPPIIGTAGDDPALVGDGRDDDIQGLGGNDVVTGGGGDDLIDGGDGVDTALYAGSSGDFLIHWYEGRLIVGDYEAEGWDSLVGVELLSFGGDSVTIDVGDVPLGTSGNDILVGSARTERIDALDGDDSLDGGGGGDWLYGGLGDDLYLPGAGDDEMTEDGGDDSYCYDLGDGDDQIWEYLGFDILAFGAGIDPLDVIVTGDGDNYVLSFVGAAGSVTLWGGALAESAIEEVHFADTTVWTDEELYDLAYGELLLIGFAPAAGGDRFPLLGHDLAAQIV